MRWWAKVERRGLPAARLSSRVESNAHRADMTIVADADRLATDAEELDRRVHTFARAVSQLRRAVEQAERVLADLERLPMTYFMDRPFWSEE